MALIDEPSLVEKVAALVIYDRSLRRRWHNELMAPADVALIFKIKPASAKRFMSNHGEEPFGYVGRSPRWEKEQVERVRKSLALTGSKHRG